MHALKIGWEKYHLFDAWHTDIRTMTEVFFNEFLIHGSKEKEVGQIFTSSFSNEWLN